MPQQTQLRYGGSTGDDGNERLRRFVQSGSGLKLRLACSMQLCLRTEHLGVYGGVAATLNAAVARHRHRSHLRSFDENYENVILAHLPQLDGFYVALEESVCLSQK